MANKSIQIDVKGPKKDDPSYMECNLWINGYVTKVYMPKISYEILIDIGFFIRDGKEVDSANVLNTTKTFIEKA